MPMDNDQDDKLAVHIINVNISMYLMDSHFTYRRAKILQTPQNEHFLIEKFSYLWTGFLEVDTKSVGISCIMFDKLGQCAESDTSCNKKSAFIKLTNSVMLHSVTVTHCFQTSNKNSSFAICRQFFQTHFNIVHSSVQRLLSTISTR